MCKLFRRRRKSETWVEIGYQHETREYLGKLYPPGRRWARLDGSERDKLVTRRLRGARR